MEYQTAIKNEHISVVCKDVDKYQKHIIEQKKPETKEYILNDPIYMNSKASRIT